MRCFNLAEKYRTPVIFLMDEIIGHLREGIEIPEKVEIIDRPTIENPHPKRPAYAPTDNLIPAMAPFGEGQRYNITGLLHDESGFPTNDTKIARELVERILKKIENNYDDIVQVEETLMDDAEVAVFCFGGTARAAKAAVLEARKKGIKCGMFRPITIWPFADKELEKAMKNVKKIVVAEHNYGQLVNEVRRVVGLDKKIEFIGKVDGTIITPDEILAKIEKEA